ncbi:MAG: hypothetical protein KF745_01680 [Phycisphaeraceae bacterium]|nr:hypothetical protein [Phycisphaeraceae bacterium]
MRYYVYVSKAKIDMLYPQMDPGITKTIKSSLEASIPGIFKAAREEQRTANARPTEYIAKLLVLEEYMKRVYTPGKPGENCRLMSGSFSARVFNYRWNSILFVGQANGQTIALSGSRDHLVGARPLASKDDKDDGFLPSFGQHVLSVIEEMGKEHHPNWNIDDAGKMLEDRSCVTRVERPAWARVLDGYRNQSVPQAQTFQFFAYQFAGHSGYWLGTPLYLAQGADTRQ